MSLPLTDANGVVQTIANGTPVVWNAGLGYDANGLLCVTSTLSATDVWINGWRRDTQGRLVVSQSSPEGQPFIYNAGWPTDKNTGAIITQQNIPTPTDPRIAGVAVGPLGGVYMTEGGYIWTPLALWPDGVDSPGMWIDPSLLTASFNDYTGTTPVAVPGTVADSANPVGLALDIRAGATAVTDPGNHMLQATSAARPLMSARVNLLTYTEDFGAAAWQNPTWGSGTSAYTRNYAAAPDGTLTATRFVATAPTTSPVSGGSTGTYLTIGLHTRTVWLKSNTGSDQLISLHIDLQVGSLRTVTPTWAPYKITFSDASFGLDLGVYRSGGAGDTDASCDILMWHPQMEPSSTATDYQSVPGNGSTYATDFPIFQKYDGVDDGMATASFAAGTLINGMDCMIAVRRDSGSNCVAGLYNGISDATKFFGMAESASGSGCVGSGAGTPTVWVDNTQLTGGTAVTRGTLHTALTAGNIHVLEFRNLDLSAWTATGFGLYSSYVFPGARGDILLYPSSASTADKDAARQYLADKYGVTLA